MAEASRSILERLDEHLLAAMHDGHTEQHRSDVSVVELAEACQKMHEDQAEIERLRGKVTPLEVAAERLSELLKRGGATQPFWTTTAGGGQKPYINIVCQDIEIMHALDDFLRAACRSALQPSGNRG